MGELPQLFVRGDLLPEVWEKSLELLFANGIKFYKESYRYEEKRIGIIEASVTMVVRRPLEEPMIHLGCEGLRNLGSYVDEVLSGTKDDYVRRGVWDYTYHQLLRAYKPVSSAEIDQVDYIVRKLDEVPFSNRAQGTTWMPWKHPNVGGPPCMQRIWCKVIDGELEMHTDWRSRDAYNAAFMNMYAMVHLQKAIADRLRVEVGQYVDRSDSYHVYQYNIDAAKRFLETCEDKRRRGVSAWANSSILDRFSRPEH